MKIILLTVGSPMLSFAKEGFMEYLKRVQKFASVDHKPCKDDASLLKKIDELSGYTKVLLDEQGREMSSRAFAEFLETKQNHSESLCFIIGGPDGHPQELRERGYATLSLSQLTLPHDVAMLFFSETLYRSLSIINNHPYHRD